MIGYGLIKGERMNLVQTTGVLVALAGLIGLLLPGISAPPILGAILMLGAGVSWGIYSLRGCGVVDATRETAANFVRAVPFALLLRVGTLDGCQSIRGGICDGIRCIGIGTRLRNLVFSIACAHRDKCGHSSINRSSVGGGGWCCGVSQ